MSRSLFSVLVFILEVITSVCILFAGYAIVKGLHESEISYFATFLLSFCVAINSSLWINEYFVKRDKLIRTSIVVDSTLIVIIVTLFTACQLFVKEISVFLINDIEILRIENTFGAYKFLLNQLEIFVGCCRVPSLMNYGSTDIRFCCKPNGLECENFELSCDNLSIGSAIVLMPLCVLLTIKLYGSLKKFKENIQENLNYEKLNKIKN